MKLIVTERGFEMIEHPWSGIGSRLVQQSSAIGDYPDSMTRPGSSFLWIGQDFHLSREEVAELSRRLKLWLDTGHLCSDEERKAVTA